MQYFDLLNYEPMTGYELKKMIDISISHFWPAVQSQIYKTVSRMEANDWLTVETISQAIRPPKKVYSITQQGKKELLNWLETPQPRGETRIAWMIQVFFAGQMDDEKIHHVLLNLIGDYKKRLQAFSLIPEENREAMQDDNSRDRFFWMLTVDYGVSQTIAQIQWLENVIRTVENHEYILPTLKDHQLYS